MAEVVVAGVGVLGSVMEADIVEAVGRMRKGHVGHRDMHGDMGFRAAQREGRRRARAVKAKQSMRSALTRWV